MIYLALEIFEKVKYKLNNNHLNSLVELLPNDNVL